MKKIVFISMLCAVALSACSTSIKTTVSKTIAPLDIRQEVKVFDTEDPIPASAIEIGTIKIGDTGFTVNCGWELVLQQAKDETRKMGGNALKIITHNLPNALGSNCHRITANVLIIDPTAINTPVIIPFDSTLLKSGCALVHFFRPGGAGALVGYDIHLGDSIIWRATNNSKKSIKLRKDGLNTLWAQTESKTELPVNLKIGQEYYVRCSITMGAFVGRPKLEMVENSAGKMEFKAIKMSKSKQRDTITLLNGQEIECQITKEEAELVYYTDFKSEEDPYKSILKSSIKSIQRAE